MDIGGMFKNLMNWQPAGSPEWSNIQGAKQKQQQLDIQKQQEERAARQSDQDFAEHMQSIGAKPIFHGLVRDEAPLPDMGVSVPIYRPPNEERLRTKQKTATGDNVEWEVPNEQEQLLHRAMMSAQGLKAANSPQILDEQRKAALNKQQTDDTLAQMHRQMAGVPISDLFSRETLTKLGVNPDTKLNLLPEEFSSELGKMTAPTISSQSRERVADQGNANKAQIAADNRTARADQQSNLLKWRENDSLRSEGLKDVISRRQAAVQSGYNPNLAPVMLQRFNDQVQPLQQQADRGRAAITQGLDLVDETKTPNGETFTNPFTGRKMEMNDGVRDMLHNRLDIERQNVDKLHQQISTLAGSPAASAQQQPSGGSAGTGSGGGPRSNGAAGLTGEDYLKTQSPEDAAVIRGMASGAIPAPNATSRSPIAQRRLKQLMTFDPDFSTQRAQVRKAFTSGPDGKNIGSLNTAVVHLDQFADAADALNNGTFRPGNAAFNSLSSAFGSKAPTNFEALKSVVSGEMANALKGNATDQEIHSISSTIMSSSSPEQLKGFIDTQLHTLGAKLNTYQERYSQQIPGDKVWSPVLPSAAKVFGKHGVNPTGANGGGQQGGSVKVISPEGKAGTIPAEKLQEALKRGFKQVQ